MENKEERSYEKRKIMSNSTILNNTNRMGDKRNDTGDDDGR
jgi:hypothetical protein